MFWQLIAQLMEASRPRKPGEGNGGEGEAEAEAPPLGCPTCDWAAFKSLGSDRRRAVLARREAGVTTGLSTERS